MTVVADRLSNPGDNAVPAWSVTNTPEVVRLTVPVVRGVKISRATVAQMTERRGLIRILEERKRKGVRMRQYRERERVTPRHCLETETVPSATGNSAIHDLSRGSHQLYEPDLTKGDEIVKTEGAEAEQRLNPRVGELVKGLVARLDIRARAGV